MCLLLVMRFADGGLVVGANRDELRARPSRPPFVWDTAPPVLAGRDEQAGGTWLAVNAAGVVAAVTNRGIAGGPVAGRPSRGALPLRACAHGSAAEARRALAEHLAAVRYNGFNLFVADRREAFVIESVGAAPAVRALEPGLAVCGNGGWDDRADVRVARAYDLLAEPPADAQSALRSFREVCRDSRPLGDAAALCVPAGPAGTVSSTLICLDPAGRLQRYLHAPGPPCRVDYQPYPPTFERGP